VRGLSCFSEQMHEAAMARVGFEEFGDPSYHGGLRALLEAYDSDMQFTPEGWNSIYDGLVTTLAGRLHAQQGWIAHPWVLSRPIRRSLVITGLPRTGTTALHRLLCQDSQLQGLETWLTHAPMIRPSRETWESYGPCRACVSSHEAIEARTPELRAAHEFGAGAVEECNQVLAQSFRFRGWSILLPTYALWFQSQDMKAAYRRYADVLRLIGARESHKPWVLKSPFHATDLDALLSVLPDACIIHMHRDPLQAIPSMYSLSQIYLRNAGIKFRRPELLGWRMLEYWRSALDRMQAVREGAPTQFFDVYQRRFVGDPLTTVRSIYEYFGLTLSSGTVHKMRAWVRDNNASRGPKHQYSLESYRVTATEICESFADYRSQHRF
jgi:hypothetical protein